MKSLCFCLIIVFALYRADFRACPGVFDLLQKSCEGYSDKAEAVVIAKAAEYAEAVANLENTKHLERDRLKDSATGELCKEMEEACELTMKEAYELTAMEALDLVKEGYAANFERYYITQDQVLYCYKLPDAQLYLAYEGFGSTEDEYLIHLYEFVVDDPESGIGHCYSYAWYSVDKKTGRIYVYEP